MRVNRLHLENFKGVKNLSVEADGRDIVIYGPNGSGKSTVGDALFWLLFDKNQSFGTCSVKTLDSDGKEIHGLEHTVEGEFDTESGTVTLKKTLTESWVKKRGSAHKVFSGHTTKYWVDGVPCKLKDYTRTLSNFLPELGVVKLLVSPFYFASVLPWQERRAILMEICGDVTLEDVLAQNPEFESLPTLLQGRSVDDYKKIVDESLRKINKELKAIPIRIDEAERLLPDVSGLDKRALKSERVAVNKRIKELTEKIRDAKVDDGKAAVRAEIADLQHSLSRLALDIDRDQHERIMGLRDELRVVQQQIEDFDKVVRLAAEASAELEKNNREMAELRAEFKKLSAESFDPSSVDVCPTCNRPLPVEECEEAFNKYKATRLEEIKARGQELKKVNEDYEEIAKGGEEAIEELAELHTKEKALQKKLEAAKKFVREDFLLYKKELEEKIAAKSEGLLKSGSPLYFEELKAERSELEKKSEQLKEKLDLFKAREEVKARVKELKSQEEVLSLEYETAEDVKYTIENFIRAKVEILEEKVTAKLGYPGLNVKLFAEQINGGLTECCELTYNGVPFGAGLNHGAQIVVGLHLTTVFAEHYGVSLPVVIDNAEAVTEIPPVDTQTIELTVSDHYEGLTIFQKENENE